jgi:DNA modification methylase
MAQSFTDARDLSMEGKSIEARMRHLRAVPESPKVFRERASDAETVPAPPGYGHNARQLPEFRDGSAIFETGVHNGCEWALLKGDARQALITVVDASVDCVITSPPYFWQRDYEVEGQIGHEDTVHSYLATLLTTFHEMRRTMKPTGVVFLVIGDTYYSGKGRPKGWDPKHKSRSVSRNKYRAVDRPGFGLPKKTLIGIPWRLALAMIDDGWILRSAVTWKRPRPLAEATARDRPWRSSDYVFIFSLSGRYYFNRSGLGGEEDVWEIDAPSQNGWTHAAPFPEALVARCLGCGCPETGLVLDPFVGSGTTLKVAVASGRTAIGIDLNETYLAMAKRRINSSP